MWPVVGKDSWDHFPDHYQRECPGSLFDALKSPRTVSTMSMLLIQNAAKSPLSVCRPPDILKQLKTLTQSGSLITVFNAILTDLSMYFCEMFDGIAYRL